MGIPSLEPARRSQGLSLEVPCDLGAVRPAVLAVLSFLQEQGVDGEDLAACELALVEACNNAIQYVDAAHRDRPVVVGVACDEASVELRVEDHTPGFTLSEAALLPEAEAEHGRGLFLIRSLTSGLDYLRGVDRNCLVMQRRRATRASGAGLSRVPKLEDLIRKLAEEDRTINDMADELSSCYESLAAIFRYGSEQHPATGLNDFARRLLDDLLRITAADWYVCRLVSPAGEELEVFVASDPALYGEPIRLQGAADESMERKAFLTRQDAWAEGAHPASADEPLALARPGSVMLVHPISVADTLAGTLAVGRDRVLRPFTAANTSVIHTFADFLAIQLVNTRFQEERLGNLLVARELDIAQHIQRSLLLKTIPKVRGVAVAGYCESARQVGGDSYDVLKLSDHEVLVMISDVMGKGIPAAMFAVILRSLVRALRRLASTPARLLEEVNRLLFDELSEVEMFITAQLVYVDGDARTVRMANAGHCPILVAAPPGAAVKEHSPDGMPLGVVADMVCEEVTLPWDAGARMLLYTDGLTEADNLDGEWFGQSRLVDWLGECRAEGLPAEAMQALLLRRLGEFTGSRSLNDDRTFVVLTGE